MLPVIRFFIVLVLLLSAPQIVIAGEYQDKLKAEIGADYTGAFAKFQKRAASGDAKAQYKIGYMYEEGLGVEQDAAKALKWYISSAEMGFDQAQLQLGIRLLNGRDVKAKPIEAAEWFEKSAEQGNMDARLWLANMNQMGNGIPRNNHTAFKLFELAAKQGSAYAQKKTAIMLRNGDGISQNVNSAHMWLVLAEGGNTKNAMKLKLRLEKTMSIDEIKTSEEKAKNCKNSGFKDCG